MKLFCFSETSLLVWGWNWGIGSEYCNSWKLGLVTQMTVSSNKPTMPLETTLLIDKSGTWATWSTWCVDACLELFCYADYLPRGWCCQSESPSPKSWNSNGPVMHLLSGCTLESKSFLSWEISLASLCHLYTRLLYLASENTPLLRPQPCCLWFICEHS